MIPYSSTNDPLVSILSLWLGLPERRLSACACGTGDARLKSVQKNVVIDDLSEEILRFSLLTFRMRLEPRTHPAHTFPANVCTYTFGIKIATHVDILLFILPHHSAKLQRFVGKSETCIAKRAITPQTQVHFSLVARFGVHPAYRNKCE